MAAAAVDAAEAVTAYLDICAPIIQFTCEKSNYKRELNCWQKFNQVSH